MNRAAADFYALLVHEPFGVDMHRDHHQGPRHASKHHERKEWDRLADDRHELNDERRDRSSWKAQRAFGARREEAGRQIRELRSRY